MDFWAIFEFWRNQDIFEKIKIQFLVLTFHPDIQITWFLHRWVSFFVIFPGIPIMAIVLVIGLMIKYGQYGQYWPYWPYLIISPMTKTMAMMGIPGKITKKLTHLWRNQVIWMSGWKVRTKNWILIFSKISWFLQNSKMAQKSTF